MPPNNQHTSEETTKFTTTGNVDVTVTNGPFFRVSKITVLDFGSAEPPDGNGKIGIVEAKATITDNNDAITFSLPGGLGDGYHVKDSPPSRGWGLQISRNGIPDPLIADSAKLEFTIAENQTHLSGTIIFLDKDKAEIAKASYNIRKTVLTNSLPV